jgi:hypothetical protein
MALIKQTELGVESEQTRFMKIPVEYRSALLGG